MIDWNQKPRCRDCGKEIDPDVCWCGMSPDAHNPWYDGHAPVPMGCECGFVKRETSEND